MWGQAPSSLPGPLRAFEVLLIHFVFKLLGSHNSPIATEMVEEIVEFILFHEPNHLVDNVILEFW